MRVGSGKLGFGVAVHLYDFFTGPAYRVQRSMNALGLSTTAMGARMERDMRSLKATFAMFAGSTGVAALAAAPVLVAANFDAMRAQFEVMLGSVHAAEKALTDLRYFAKTTPFGTEETVKAAKQLLAFGVQQKNLMQDMKMLGDISAAVGKENLEPIILAYGQARTKGFLMGDELRQFAERGVPIMDYVKKALGTEDGNEAFKAITERKVTFEMLRDMFRQMTSDGGRFANMMIRLEGRPAQILDRIGGELYEIQLKFGEALMDTAKPMLQLVGAITGVLNEMAPTWVGAVAANIALLAGSLTAVATAAYLFKNLPMFTRWLAGSYLQAMGMNTAAQHLLQGGLGIRSTLNAILTGKYLAFQQNLVPPPKINIFGNLATSLANLRAQMQKLPISLLSNYTKKVFFFAQGGALANNAIMNSLRYLPFDAMPDAFTHLKKGAPGSGLYDVTKPFSIGRRNYLPGQQLKHEKLNKFIVNSPLASRIVDFAAMGNAMAPGVRKTKRVLDFSKIFKSMYIGGLTATGKLGLAFKKLGNVVAGPYRQVNKFGLAMQRMGSMYQPQIAAALVLGAVVGLLISGYINFQKVLRGTEAPASGFIGMLQKIGGAMVGVYDLVSSWDGERMMLNLDMANALSKLGILEKVAKLATLFIRIKELIHGFFFTFIEVMSLIGEAVSLVLWGIGQVLTFVAKMIGATSALQGDIRVWRILGGVIGLYVSGMALVAARSFIIMAWAALKAGAMSLIAFSPVLAIVVAITAGVVALLYMFGKLDNFSLSEPFERFATGVDGNQKVYGSNFVSRDLIPSVATQRRQRQQELEANERRMKEYNERPQNIQVDVIVDGKVLAKSVDKHKRVMDAQ